jgi:hypothetical protein
VGVLDIELVSRTARMRPWGCQPYCQIGHLGDASTGRLAVSTGCLLAGQSMHSPVNCSGRIRRATSTTSSDRAMEKDKQADACLRLSVQTAQLRRMIRCEAVGVLPTDEPLVVRRAATTGKLRRRACLFN